MATVFYKKYFEVRLFHQSAPAKLCAAFALKPTKACEQLLKNYGMVWRAAAGKITVFYKGLLQPDGAPPNKKISPFPAIVPEGTEFLFVVLLLDQNIMQQTSVPGEADIAATDKNKAIPASFIKTAALSLRIQATVTTRPYETFQVFTHDEKKVQQALVKKSEDGFYTCSADLSLLPPNVYSFTLESDNSVRRKFYVDTPGEMFGQYGFLRLVKDGTWLLPDKIVPAPALPDYNVINYTFQKL